MTDESNISCRSRGDSHVREGNPKTPLSTKKDIKKRNSLNTDLVAQIVAQTVRSLMERDEEATKSSKKGANQSTSTALVTITTEGELKEPESVMRYLHQTRDELTALVDNARSHGLDEADHRHIKALEDRLISVEKLLYNQYRVIEEQRSFAETRHEVGRSHLSSGSLQQKHHQDSPIETNPVARRLISSLMGKVTSSSSLNPEMMRRDHVDMTDSRAILDRIQRQRKEEKRLMYFEDIEERLNLIEHMMRFDQHVVDDQQHAVDLFYQQQLHQDFDRSQHDQYDDGSTSHSANTSSRSRNTRSQQSHASTAHETSGTYVSRNALATNYTVTSPTSPEAVQRRQQRKAYIQRLLRNHRHVESVQYQPNEYQEGYGNGQFDRFDDILDNEHSQYREEDGYVHQGYAKSKTFTPIHTHSAARPSYNEKFEEDVESVQSLNSVPRYHMQHTASLPVPIESRHAPAYGQRLHSSMPHPPAPPPPLPLSTHAPPPTHSSSRGGQRAQPPNPPPLPFMTPGFLDQSRNVPSSSTRSSISSNSNSVNNSVPSRTPSSRQLGERLEMDSALLSYVRRSGAGPIALQGQQRDSYERWREITPTMPQYEYDTLIPSDAAVYSQASARKVSGEIRSSSKESLSTGQSGRRIRPEEDIRTPSLSRAAPRITSTSNRSYMLHTSASAMKTNFDHFHHAQHHPQHWTPNGILTNHHSPPY